MTTCEQFVLLVVSSYFLAYVISFEVLAILFAAYSEGFPLVAQLFIAQARALPFFGMPGFLSGVFFFWSGICGAFFLCLLTEVGFPNHGKGRACFL